MNYSENSRGDIIESVKELNDARQTIFKTQRRKL
jgi:hypothetical protein